VGVTELTERREKLTERFFNRRSAQRIIVACHYCLKSVMLTLSTALYSMHHLSENQFHSTAEKTDLNHLLPVAIAVSK